MLLQGGVSGCAKVLALRYGTLVTEVKSADCGNTPRYLRVGDGSADRGVCHVDDVMMKCSEGTSGQARGVPAEKV